MVIDTDKLQGDADYRQEFRHRCETDHFFLADIVGLTRYVRRIHEPVVKGLYFPKNRNLPIEEQHEKHNRMHLDPRTTGKTTWGRIDSLQWILAFPETITLLNITATQKLGQGISRNTHVYLGRRPAHPRTPLLIAYPELEFEITTKECPATWNTNCSEVGRIDATVDYTSPETSQSGWHPYILNVDDMVDTINSGITASHESRQNVIAKYNTNKNTRLPGGFTNIRGTRYHPEELWGTILDTMDPNEWVVLIRHAVTVKDGTRLMPGEFPDEDDVILNFAEMPGMDYATLRQMFMVDYESFMCQQQNDPQGGSVPTFDPPLYQSMLIQPERVPALGDTFVCWRMQYGGKDYMAKYAEGIAARVWEGRLYVLDAWQGTYTPSRLAEKIVRECKRHQTGDIIMESLPGVQYIETHIRAEASRKNLSLRIQWPEFEEDDNNRFERIRNMEPQARAGRILISTAAAGSSEIRRQLLHFRLVRENGIADCISRLVGKVPLSQFRKEIEEEEAELQLQRRHDVMAQFVYGGMGGQQELEDKRAQQRAATEEAWRNIDTMGLRDILGGLDG